MPAENLDLVRRVYELAARGELAEAVRLLHPEVEFHTYEHAPEAGVYRGRDAVLRYNEQLAAQFERFDAEIEELVDAGECVVVISTQHAVPKGSSQEMAVHMAEVWRIEDGLLRERHSYSDRAAALAAVSRSGQ